MRLIETNELVFGHGGTEVGRVPQLTFERGTVLCLLGPNGSGKTTLLKTLIGLLPPIGGTVLLEGRRIDGRTSAEIARLVGYVPQADGRYFPFTAHEIVLMGRAARIAPFAAPSAADHRHARQAIETLGIGALADRVFTELSGGERQMVLIARALAQEPAVLVMDEPTASLDYANQAMVLQTIASLAERDIAVVFSSHDPNHGFIAADQVAMLRQGRLIALGLPRDVITPPRLRDLYGVAVAVIDSPEIGRPVCAYSMTHGPLPS